MNQDEYDEMNEEIYYVDESMIAKMKAGIVGYGLVLTLFVIAPVVLTIFTSKTFTTFNLLVGLTGTGVLCWQQIKARFDILASFDFEDDEIE